MSKEEIHLQSEEDIDEGTTYECSRCGEEFVVTDEQAEEGYDTEYCGECLLAIKNAEDGEEDGEDEEENE